MNFNYQHLAFFVSAFIIVIVVGSYVFISRQTPPSVAVGFAVFILKRLMMG